MFVTLYLSIAILIRLKRMQPSSYYFLLWSRWWRNPVKQLTVAKIKYVLTMDIDPMQQDDVKKLDVLIFTCVESALDALTSAPPPGFTNVDRDHLKPVFEGLRHSHLTIRKILQSGMSPSAVDVLAIARLQLETLYSLCFILQNASNLRLFLKNGWKKKYVRFLLEREERALLPRFKEFFDNTAVPIMDELRRVVGVTDEEKLTIEHDELDIPVPSGFKLSRIGKFPTPGGVIDAISNHDQKRMLERLYPEYQFLCSFAHGDNVAAHFKAVFDPQGQFQKTFPAAQVEDFFQRQVGENSVIYSVVSSVQAATEIAAIYPANVALLARVTEAWNWLLKGTLLARPVWELRARKVLPLI